MPLKILIAQGDNEFGVYISKGLSLLLDVEHYQLMNQGRSTLQILKTNAYDAMILGTDLGVAVTSPMVLKAIRENRTLSADCRGMPIIVLSQDARTATKVQFLDLDADDYLAIPYAHEELAARIKSVMRARVRWRVEALMEMR